MERPSEKRDIIGILKRAIAGDTDAYGLLYGIYVDRIYRYVYYQVGDRMTAEDVTQEVFVKAWKAIRTCRGKEDTFTAWLYRVAHNHVVDAFRKTPREVSIETVEVIDDCSPDQLVESTLEWQRVMQAVAELPDAQRQVILLKFVNEAENHEISRITGKREGAVRALQMRALANLRQKLVPGVSNHVG